MIDKSWKRVYVHLDEDICGHHDYVIKTISVNISNILIENAWWLMINHRKAFMSIEMKAFMEVISEKLNLLEPIT